MKKNIKRVVINWWNNIFEDEEKLSERPAVVWEEEEAFVIKSDEKEFAATPFASNRWVVQFKGIPPYYFESYKYMGTDIHSERKLLSSKKVISDDYSVLRVILCEPEENFDISETLKQLEANPSVGDIKIRILGPKGRAIKTIVIPDCEVTEIKAFRELDYSGSGLLYGEITLKHKQRKLLSDDEQRKS